MSLITSVSWGSWFLPFVMVQFGAFNMLFGGILKLNTHIYGGVFSWICALASAYFGQPELFFALTILGGNIIPLHILRFTYHEKNKRT
jgi:hypothetical protein